MIRELDRQDTGLLITVDELHHSNSDEIMQLTAAIQHAFRENKKVAFVGAGLPLGVRVLLDQPQSTFLRRADRHHLGPVPRADVEDSLRDTIVGAGRQITDDALAVAVTAVEGYPFLIQLVGYWAWRADPGSDVIDLNQARRGIDGALRRLGDLVIEPALQDLSVVDRQLLAAMAVDDGPSAMGDLAQRLGRSSNYISQYRLRLIEADMIRSTGHGLVDFALPYLRQFLRDHRDQYS